MPTGQEFRALFISTVRTVHTCKTNTASGTVEKLYLEFLTDPKLLNTAVTRARSLVAVVGDPVSLCTVGDCRGLWWDYIKRCDENRGVFGTTMPDLEKEITASSTLNPDATPFMPKGADAEELLKPTKQTSAEAEEGDIQEYSPDVEANEENSTTAISVTEQKQEDDDQSGKDSESSHAEEDSGYDDESGSSTYEDFEEEYLEDATVFPRNMDEIIKALDSKCKEQALQKDTSHGLMYQESEFPPLQRGTSASKPKRPQHSMITARARGGGAADLAQRYPGDYDMRVINGRVEIRLVNLGLQQTLLSQTRRLLVSSRYQECLQPEVLRRLLLKDPHKYLACSLRLNPERGYFAYGEIQDTDTADIQINGRVRQAFDKDTVVIKIVRGEDRIQGQILGKMTIAVLFMSSQSANIRSAHFETRILHLRTFALKSSNTQNLFKLL